jgi:hypothetical protein
VRNANQTETTIVGPDRPVLWLTIILGPYRTYQCFSLESTTFQHLVSDNAVQSSLQRAERPRPSLSSGHQLARHNQEKSPEKWAKCTAMATRNPQLWARPRTQSRPQQRRRPQQDAAGDVWRDHGSAYRPLIAPGRQRARHFLGGSKAQIGCGADYASALHCNPERAQYQRTARNRVRPRRIVRETGRRCQGSLLPLRRHDALAGGHKHPLGFRVRFRAGPRLWPCRLAVAELCAQDLCPPPKLSA